MLTKRKPSGLLWCQITAVTPLWLDVKIKGSGSPATVFFMTKKPNQATLKYFNDIKDNNWFLTLVVAPMETPTHYKFLSSSSKAMMLKNHSQKIRFKREELSRTLNEDVNVVKAKHANSKFGMVSHAEFLTFTDNTSNSIKRALLFSTGEKIHVNKRKKSKARIKEETKAARAVKLSNYAKKPWSEERKKSFAEKMQAYHKNKTKKISQDIII